MKITGIKVRQVEVPLIEPFRISLGIITHSRSAIVSVETDEGLVGYGEGAPAILISGESLSGTADVIHAFEKELIGVDPTDLEKVYWIMDRTAAHSGSAKTAIDIACYDLLGKKAGLPVYKLLGGYQNYMDTDMTVGIAEPSVMAAKAKKHVEAGFDTIKTKVGTTFAEDLARVKAIREAVGDDVKIRVDANQAWQAKEAVRLIERLNEYDIELVEKHHNQKLDAPSGTALALADSINEAADNQYHYVYDRSQVRQKRDQKEIGISAVRGGTIVGDHEVIFAGQDEVIEFKHTAYSKAVFGKGAVEAAKFLAGKPAGRYDMSDVIQL